MSPTAKSEKFTFAEKLLISTGILVIWSMPFFICAFTEAILRIILLGIICVVLVGIAFGCVWFLQHVHLILFTIKKRVDTPPASFLLKISNLLPKKYRRNLEQEISDMRLEYYEALSERRIWQARCIIASYYIGLCWSVVMWISDKVRKVNGIVPKKN
ncbi:MAG TPA: hypothetical protein VK400_08420 [Pyrinomonadaceae bacterium]|nr:hypothetical protein [Pyrinomonadaceae bacterium]